MPIAGLVPDGLNSVGSAVAFRSFTPFATEPAPNLPLSIGVLSSYGFNEVLVFWVKTPDNGNPAFVTDTMTLRAVLADPLVPHSIEYNIRQNEMWRCRTDGADYMEIFLTGFTFTEVADQTDLFSVYVAGASPVRFQTP